jgi:hypothetical protein
MRCMACGAEMILVNVVQDDTMAVSGFEHHTFMCSACQDTERRLVFSRGEPEAETEPSPAQPAQPTAPAETIPEEPGATPGFFRRVLAKLRGREADVQRWGPLSVLIARRSTK